MAHKKIICGNSCCMNCINTWIYLFLIGPTLSKHIYLDCLLLVQSNRGLPGDWRQVGTSQPVILGYDSSLNFCYVICDGTCNVFPDLLYSVYSPYVNTYRSPMEEATWLTRSNLGGQGFVIVIVGLLIFIISNGRWPRLA